MRTTTAPAHDDPVSRFRLHHAHDDIECPAAFAAWRGFMSPLRHQPTTGRCAGDRHELWWDVDADNPDAALTLLPPFLASRSEAIAVTEVPIP
jgi:hypothetical protein